ncbi:hypothetical protein HAX54_051516 [Datura stramonium]|uniref:Uncharacterized protein n=1 Tax=Datura stramonium TaxID=4076 RepID=A0ABS8SY82_DATST|nr:hypothetical protein [Datura stramonium]
MTSINSFRAVFFYHSKEKERMMTGEDGGEGLPASRWSLVGEIEARKKWILREEGKGEGDARLVVGGLWVKGENGGVRRCDVGVRRRRRRKKWE